MIYVYVIVLGLVQGLTEFLPVSSSGHLILLENLFDKPSLFFNVMLHFATLMSIMFVMRKRIKELIVRPLNKTNAFIIVSTVPTGILAFIFKTKLPEVLDGAILPFGFLLTSVFLIMPKIYEDRPLDKKTSFIAGIAQGLAVLPGLSRSGTVISTMHTLGTPDTQNVEFAFLMSVPVIIGSTAVELVTAPKIYISDPVPILIGMAVAFISGVFALKFMLTRLNRKKIVYFAPYTFILSALAFVSAQL